ncbi:MAG: hypothetical protein KGL39_21540 [Patescibacteria group bacterium]|nr:hypothetical protein [Patescibacteria group bacterium]
MDLSVNLQRLASQGSTRYVLGGTLMAPEEVYSRDGFLPLIGRMAEKRARMLFGSVRCGFSYTYSQFSLFGERLDFAAEEEGLLDRSQRLLALVGAAQVLTGFDQNGVVDLSPVHALFFTQGPAEFPQDTQWPLYRLLPLDPPLQ